MIGAQNSKFSLSFQWASLYNLAAVKKKGVRKIVLTGGPGAGKTAALELCRTEFADRVVIVPEAATLLYSGGFPRYKKPKGIEMAQEAIYLVQTKLEAVQEHHYPRLALLCDRGTIDGAAYWPSGGTRFFRRMRTSLQAELKRYDIVLFLESAAAGGDCIYSDNAHRIESPKQALSLDRKLHSLWSKHPKFMYIERQETLALKMEITRSILRKVLS